MARSSSISSEEEARLAPLADFAAYIPLRIAVLTRLKRAIVEGTLKPGELLSENKLAAELVVSRTPVREALRVLESEGLVTVLPGRKIVVSVPSQQDIDEIYDIRLIVETEALRRIRPQDRKILGRLDECLEEAAAALRNNNVTALERNNTAFHMALVSALNNERLRDFIDSVHDNAARFRRYSLAEEGWAEKGIQEHKRLVTLLKKGENEAAVRLLKQHLSTGAKIVGQMFNRQNGK